MFLSFSVDHYIILLLEFYTILAKHYIYINQDGMIITLLFGSIDTQSNYIIWNTKTNVL